MDSILIVDDESGIRDILSSILEDEGFNTIAVDTGEKALEVIDEKSFSLIFLDLWLPNIGGMDVLKKVKTSLYPPEIIVISGHANVDIAVQAIKEGAFDCLEKPLDLTRVLTLTRNAINIYNLKKENRALKETSIGASSLIGNSPQIQNIKRIISQVAPTDSRVILLGENGTGKEVIAKEIHNNSKRKNKPFIEVNCAAIPDNLLESELFGHEKGAFTGAVDQRLGKFELANGGTLFLDEIADMSITAQAKVLRAIQEQRFHRVGSEKPIDVDIRIISATNKEIEKEISNGNFREDLYFRLSVIPINIPPLRERNGDIILLAKYFLDKINKDQLKNLYFNEQSLNSLNSITWPGNVRELKNFIERLSIVSENNEIDIKNFIESNNKAKNDNFLKEFKKLSLSKAKDEFEKLIICSKLEETDGNITKAAGELGVYPSNLHNKINKYGINIKK